MHPLAEQLAGSLVYEGYALYPYTPGAPKNASPTPFGIVYPPAYAAALPSTHSRLQVQLVATAPAEATLEAQLLFLQSAGSRHQAIRRRVELEPRALGEIAREPTEHGFAFEPGVDSDTFAEPAPEGGVTGEPRSGDAPVLSGSITVRAEPIAADAWLLTFEAANTTPVPEDAAGEMERPEALRRSLLSAHALIGLAEGRFVSPLERSGEHGESVAECENVNSWPVLASPEDDAVIGAAYFLPDHPEIAPESKVDFFDNTEIEEALLLHVKTLSDDERAEIAEQDPAVREMLERADSATDEDLAKLHGRVEIRDAPGESEVVIDGRTLRRSDKVVLRPGREGDVYDSMLDGRTATIERIYIDYDGRAHLGVSVDDDPMNEILRDSGRFLFFFADEVEPAGRKASQ